MEGLECAQHFLPFFFFLSFSKEKHIPLWAKLVSCVGTQPGYGEIINVPSESLVVWSWSKLLNDFCLGCSSWVYRCTPGPCKPKLCVVRAPKLYLKGKKEYYLYNKDRTEEHDHGQQQSGWVHISFVWWCSYLACSWPPNLSFSSWAALLPALLRAGLCCFPMQKKNVV